MMARRLLQLLAAAATLLPHPSAAPVPPGTVPAYWEHVQATDPSLMTALGTATVTEAGFLGVKGPQASRRIELRGGTGMVTGPNVFAVIPGPVSSMTWTFWLKNNIECATNGGISVTPCVLLRVRSETRTDADFFSIRWSSANPLARSFPKGRLMISVVMNEAGKSTGPRNLCTLESPLIVLNERFDTANPTFHFISIAVLPGVDPATKEIRLRLNGLVIATQVCEPPITGSDVMSRPPPGPVQTSTGPWQQGADVGGEGYMYIGALHAAQLAPTVILTEAMEWATIDALKVYPFAVDDTTAFCCAEAGRSKAVCASLPLTDETCAPYPPYKYAPPTPTATSTESAVVTLTDTLAGDAKPGAETQPPTTAPDGTTQGNAGRWPMHVSSRIFLRQMKAVGVPVPEGGRGLSGLWEEEGPVGVRHRGTRGTLQPLPSPQALVFPTTTSAGSSTAQVGVALGTGVLVLFAAWAVVRALPARGPHHDVVSADC